jgi:hypothetical protein
MAPNALKHRPDAPKLACGDGETEDVEDEEVQD